MNATTEVRGKILEWLSDVLSRSSSDINDILSFTTLHLMLLSFTDALSIAEILEKSEIGKLVHESEKDIKELVKKRGHGLSKKTVRAILEKRLKEAENENNA